MSETTLLSYESAQTWRNGIHRNLKKLCSLSEERSTRGKRFNKIGDLKRPVNESMGFLTPFRTSNVSVDEQATSVEQRVIGPKTASSAESQPAANDSRESPTLNMDGPLRAGEGRPFKKYNSFNYYLVRGEGVVSVASLDPGQSLLLCKNLRRPFQNQALSRLRDKAHFQSSKSTEAISKCNYQSGYNQEDIQAEEGQSEISGLEVNGYCNKSQDLSSLTPLICRVNKLPTTRSALRFGRQSLDCCFLKNNSFNISSVGVKKLACPQNVSKDPQSYTAKEDKTSENESPNKEGAQLNFNQWFQLTRSDGDKQARSLNGLPSVRGIVNAAGQTSKSKVGGLQVGTCRLQQRQRMENWLGCTELKAQRHSKRFEQKSSVNLCPDKVQKLMLSTRHPIKGTSSPSWDPGMPNKSPRLRSVTLIKDFCQTLPYLSVEPGNVNNTNNGALTENVPRMMMTTRSQKPNKMFRESNKGAPRNARQHFDNSKDKPPERHHSAPVSCIVGMNTDTADKEKKQLKKPQAKTSRQSKKNQRSVNKSRPKRRNQDKTSRKVGCLSNQVVNCRKPALFMPSPDMLIEKTFLDQEDVDVDVSTAKKVAVVAAATSSSSLRSQKKKPSEGSSDELLNDEESFLMAKWAELRNLKPFKPFNAKMGSSKGQAGKQKKKKAVKSGRKIVKLRQCSTKKKLNTK